MRFEKQVVVVTGAASGIGRASARKFASEGARVVLGDIDKRAGEEVLAEILEAGGTACFEPTDVSEYHQVVNLVDVAVRTYGKLDVMFNNAGIGNAQVNVLKMPLEEYHRTIAVNQHSVFYGIQAAGNAMTEHGGVIINTASVYGFLADRRQFPYHASKGAVVMMTKAAALELAKYNIRVVGIAPGLIDTNIVREWKENPDFWSAVSRGQMRGKAGTPEEVANVVLFLASKDASFVNGQVYFVDDGLTSFKH